jgi:polysaccharide deacetylase family protein (PEP-CTERM system associated)
MSNNSGLKNVLSIDVEDYFQVSALANSIDVAEWDSIKPRVTENVYRLLDLFDKHDVKATHFVLGWVAERFPELIKEIDRRGHEIASHGYSHQLIYNQAPDIFKKETLDSKKILEDITGKPVIGYRAASYSITKKSLWALDILAEAGFQYDSSIFPVVHDRYGIKGSPELPHVLLTPSKQRLVEFPLSTYRLLGQTIPVAGGGYFRLYPYALSRFFYNRINGSGKPFVFYLHPWEVDPGQPRVKASWFSEFRHYNNLDKCMLRLDTLLSDFSFTTMHDKLEELGLFEAEQTVQVAY